MAESPGSTTPISVALADGNPLVLSALSELFNRDPRFTLVATSATAEGFLSTALRVPVQIGVIDWNVPVLGGQKLIDVMREQPQAPRVVVYGEDNGDLPRQAMTAGAAAFCARSGEVDTLLEACVAVAAGKMIFPFLDVRELQKDPIFSLTKRERTLLQALSKGSTNKQLAEEFGISVNTVKFHLSNLYEKLSVQNRAQAIAFFYSSNLPTVTIDSLD